ncbi:unnamed protein product [Rotaria socialis]|uniref:Poly [ADP-ribose] polymerase n=1 Tax=Rotaria socialis TaxID=392032 RepID=A0A818KSS3_9BILA|nr:unnamed protein product [Rotaria socialis]
MPIKQADIDRSINDNLRRCRLYIWRNYNGFGFTVTSESQLPPIITCVESNSPAAAAGLNIQDYVLAVNDTSTADVSHAELVAMVKNARDTDASVELLVLHQDFYRELKKVNRLFDPKRAKIIEAPRIMPINYQNFPKHQPRTCLLRLAKKEKSFGFSIVGSSTSTGLYIDEVCPNSVASNALLRENDRIIEINDEFVDDQQSEAIKKKLVQAKKAGFLKLYVIDMDTYESFRSENIPLSSNEYLHSSSIRKASTYSYNSEHQESDSDNDALVSENDDDIPRLTDVIVVCSSSEYLFKSICKAGGDSVSNSYTNQIKDNPDAPVITVTAAGRITSKMIYFLPWQSNPDESILRKSIENFVSVALEKAIQCKYRNITFPAIGCGGFGCSIQFIARTMVEYVYWKVKAHSMMVTFVIQPDRNDIYDEFKKHIDLLESPSPSSKLRIICAKFGEGDIEVEMGDITKQKVDVIVGSTSSGILTDTIINAAGKESQLAYEMEITNHPNSALIAIPSGSLSCKKIFFVKWEPNDNEEILRQSLIDLISIVVQNVISHKFTSIAFPAIGCGKHACSVDIVVQTMVYEMKKHLIQRKLSWRVKFVVNANQENVYDEFCKQVLTTEDGFHEATAYQLPATWEKSAEDKIRFTLSTKVHEYKSIVSNFDQAMKGKYTNIIKIERIQNERWYMQYLAHSKDFRKRLEMNTEKRLYHGCPEQAANAIIADCFNRSYAGVNGTVYGVGVYFSSDATYSHGYTKPNASGERCMFLSRVLVGKTTKGNSTMRTRPLGFDSTTDEKHIFVTYHDAQALAEYLITYK